MGPSVSNATGKKFVGATEWAVLVPFSAAVELLSQRHRHWWWHSAADKRFPECRPLWRPKWRCAQSSMAAMSNCQAVVTDQPVWFLHAGNADLSQSAPNDSNSVGVFHGCRPSSSVVFCNGCIVAKRCKRGPRLLLITNKKSNIGFQMTLKSMTLDDLERTIVCQSCGIVATR